MPNSIESSPAGSEQNDGQMSQIHPLEEMPSFGESADSPEAIIRSRNQKIGAMALKAAEQSSPDYPAKDPETEIRNAGDRVRPQPLNEDVTPLTNLEQASANANKTAAERAEMFKNGDF